MALPIVTFPIMGTNIADPISTAASTVFCGEWPKTPSTVKYSLCRKHTIRIAAQIKITQNTVLAAVFMLFLFALKSVSVFIYSGFLFIANGFQHTISVGAYKASISRKDGSNVFSIVRASSPSIPFFLFFRRRRSLCVRPLFRFQHPGEIPAGLSAISHVQYFP